MRNAFPLMCAMILCYRTMTSTLAAEADQSQRFVVSQSSERTPIMLEVTAVDADSNTISVKPALPPGAEARPVEPGVYLGVAGKSIAKEPEFALSIETKEKFAGEGSFSVDPEAIKSLKANYRLVALPLTEEEAKRVSSMKGIAQIKKGMPPAVKGSAKKPAGKSSELDELASMRQLKEIGVVFFAYESVNRGFPPAVIYGPDGKPWHSWRVLVAPYFDDPNAALIEDYKFDEPWDGPSNKKFLKSMPKAFARPGEDAKEGNTPYLAFVGEGAAFTGSKEFKIEKGATKNDVPKKDQTLHKFLDGTSNSVFVGCAHKEVPWTKPEDIAVTDGKATINKNGGVGFLFGAKDDLKTQLLYADAHVASLRLAEAEEMLPKMISIGGGEIIEAPAKPIGKSEKRGQGRVTFVEVDGKWTAYLEG